MSHLSVNGIQSSYSFDPNEATPETDRGNFTVAGIQCNAAGKTIRINLPQLSITGSTPCGIFGNFLHT
jgi:hypothetical protein